MNAKTKEAIERHGKSLLAAFPNCTEKNPVALCKKLRRIETSIAPIILRNCNGGVPDDEMDKATDKAFSKVVALLGEKDAGEHGTLYSILNINLDPRGYALKLSSEWTAAYNGRQYTFGKTAQPIYTDMGGYGILAPDLNQN